VPSVLRRLFHRGTFIQHDQVGEGPFLPAGLCVIESLLNSRECFQHARQLRRIVDGPIAMDYSRRESERAQEWIAENTEEARRHALWTVAIARIHTRSRAIQRKFGVV
jgi:hypothetical protein